MKYTDGAKSLEYHRIRIHFLVALMRRRRRLRRISSILHISSSCVSRIRPIRNETRDAEDDAGEASDLGGFQPAPNYHLLRGVTGTVARTPSQAIRTGSFDHLLHRISGRTFHEVAQTHDSSTHHCISHHW